MQSTKDGNEKNIHIYRRCAPQNPKQAASESRNRPTQQYPDMLAHSLFLLAPAFSQTINSLDSSKIENTLRNYGNHHPHTRTRTNARTKRKNIDYRWHHIGKCTQKTLCMASMHQQHLYATLSQYRLCNQQTAVRHQWKRTVIVKYRSS